MLYIYGMKTIVGVWYSCINLTQAVVSPSVCYGSLTNCAAVQQVEIIWWQHILKGNGLNREQTSTQAVNAFDFILIITSWREFILCVGTLQVPPFHTGNIKNHFEQTLSETVDPNILGKHIGYRVKMLLLYDHTYK